jgi:hypothetical protein
LKEDSVTRFEREPLRAPVRQQALTVVAEVAPQEGPALERLLTERRKLVQAALREVTSLHFGRFVVLPPDDEEPESDRYQLAFESNFDGELGPHVKELWAAAGEHLKEFFSKCTGFPANPDAGSFARFLADRSVTTNAFYVAHPGLTVERVRADARLRAAIDEYLDAEAPRLAERPLPQVMQELRAHLERRIAEGADFAITSVDRGLSEKQGGFFSAARPYLFELVLAVLIGIPYEIADFLRSKLRPPKLDTKKIRERLDTIGLHEDRLEQNGLTHLVPIKPGRFRRATLKLMLRVAQEAADRGSRVGQLAGLDTIHFARWAILKDGRLLFFSNYDGSWEAYLGDFIDRASEGLTMIWTNTVHFPATLFQFFFGAKDEERFKRWTRAYQLPTQIWYSAYPSLSVSEVLANAEIREILARDFDDASIRRFCELV